VPAIRTLNDKLNQLGYRPTKVAKCRPKKRFARQMRSSPGCRK
jgi:hypothetical protein